MFWKIFYQVTMDIWSRKISSRAGQQDTRPVNNKVFGHHNILIPDTWSVTWMITRIFIKKWTIARQPWPTARCPIWWRRRKLLPKFPLMMTSQLLLLPRRLAMLLPLDQVNKIIKSLLVHTLLSNQLNIKEWPLKTFVTIYLCLLGLSEWEYWRLY